MNQLESYQRRDLLSQGDDLIRQADQSLEILSSLGKFTEPDETSLDIQRRIHYSQIDFEDFLTPNQPQKKSSFEKSIQDGLLHIKAQFPDRTFDYISIDPRMCTIGDINQTLCQRRNDLNPEETAILHDGRILQDDWLAMDCKIHAGGIIQLIRKPSSRKTLSIQEEIPSLSSIYATDMSMTPGGNEESMLSIVSTNNFSTAQECASSIRPEESFFQELLEEFYGNLQIDDPNIHLCLLNQYEDICQSRLEEIENTTALINQRVAQEIYHLRSERDTWRLVYEICDLELKSIEMDNVIDDKGDPITDDEFVAYEIKQDDEIRLQKAVLAWLESIYSEKVNFTSDKRMMASRTVSLLRHRSKVPGIVQHVDPDAPLREKLSWERDDKEDQEELFESVWGFLRSGRFEDAVDLCIQLGQPWLAASISGGQICGACEEVSQDEQATLVRWGNPFRGVWKDMCWKISNLDTKDSKIDQYRQIIYATLSNNLNVLLQSSLCRSWEDHCWAYFKASIDRKEDESVYKFNCQMLQKTKHRSGPNSEHRLEIHLQRTQGIENISCGDIFNELINSKTLEVRKGSDETYHRIQEKIILNEIDAVVSDILFQEICGAGSHSWELQLEEKVLADNHDPRFLRFAAHLVLFFKSSGWKYTEMAGYMVIKAYIRHLVKHSQMKIIPFYVSRLPDGGCVEVYAQFLQRVVNSSERKVCLQVAERLFPSHLLPAITKLVVETTVYKPIKAVDDESSFLQTLGINGDDETRLRSIEWLCTYPADRAQALYQSNALMRYFIGNGNNVAASTLIEMIIPQDSLSVIETHKQNLESTEQNEAIREYLSWISFINAKKNYSNWRVYIGEECPDSYSEEKNYLQDLIIHLTDAVSALHDVLRFENGWMVGAEFKDPQSISGLELISNAENPYSSSIRRFCLPELIFLLHNVLFETAKKLLESKYHDMKDKVVELVKESVKVADLIADAHYKLYLSLSSRQMKHLLKLLHQSTLALIRLENGLYI